MEFVVSGPKRASAWCAALLPSLIDQLNLSNSRKTLIVIIERCTPGDVGYTIPVGTNSYAVVLAPNRNLTELGMTLSHEMVHVRQMARGILKKGKGGAYFWAGKSYSKKTPYLSMPWELDAFARTEILFRRAIEI
jgi:hypothetical protein